MESNILKDINLLKNINTVILDNFSNLPTNIMNNNNLSIFVMNIRSIRRHFDELVLLLDTYTLSFDIIVLCETWLDYDFKFLLNGYQTINSIGKLNKSDGVTIFIKEPIKLTDIKENVICNCNSIELSFEYLSNNFIITCIHRSPNDNTRSFLDGLEMYLNSINKSHRSTRIICGDINIDILNQNNSLTSIEYLNIMASKGFISCINKYTRVSNTSQSCIDHMFINNIDTDSVNSYILKSDVTDHYATILYIQNDVNLADNTNKKLSEIGNKINIDHLNMLNSIEDWDNLLCNNDVNKAYETFNNIINQLISLSLYNTTGPYKNNNNN